jgi:SAM-dependent methyltransferase
MTDLLTRSIERLPRWQQVRCHAVLNSVNGLSDRFLRRNEGGGMDGDLRQVGLTLESLEKVLRTLPLAPGAELNVVELGPGRTPHVGGAFALCGASSVVGLDVVSHLNNDADARPDAYLSLAEELATGSMTAFRETLGVDAASVYERASSTDRLPLVFGAFDGEHLPIPSSSIDLVISRSVLEHVRERRNEGLIRELYRVLRPGGSMVHWIDLRDHFHIAGNFEVEGDWLAALRYSEQEYENMFENRPVYINRLRSSEWRATFTASGFELDRWTKTRLPLPEGFTPDRLDPRWSSLSLDELSVGVIEIGVHKPYAERSADG